MNKSCEHASTMPETGKKWQQRSEVQLRIRELKDGSNTVTLVTKAYVLNGLKKNAEESRLVGQYKSSNEALKILYDIIKTDREVAEGLSDGRPLSGDLRESLRNALSQTKALPAPTPTVGELLETEGEEVEVER